MTTRQLQPGAPRSQVRTVCWVTGIDIPLDHIDTPCQVKPLESLTWLCLCPHEEQFSVVSFPMSVVSCCFIITIKINSNPSCPSLFPDCPPCDSYQNLTVPGQAEISISVTSVMAWWCLKLAEKEQDKSLSHKSPRSTRPFISSVEWDDSQPGSSTAHSPSLPRLDIAAHSKAGDHLRFWDSNIVPVSGMETLI